MAVYPLRQMVVAMFCWVTAGSMAPGVHVGSGKGPGPAWQEAGTVPVTWPGSCTATRAPDRVCGAVEDDSAAVTPALMAEHPAVPATANVSNVMCNLRAAVPPLRSNGLIRLALSVEQGAVRAERHAEQVELSRSQIHVPQRYVSPGAQAARRAASRCHDGIRLLSVGCGIVVPSLR